MASDLSSGCTEANEIFDDEKEEGEISLEDVSSSEDAPPYRYQPRTVFGQCPHCLSMGHCNTWCKSLTLNKKIFVRASQREPFTKVQAHSRAEVAYIIAQDAGKENRRHHRHHSHHQRPAAAALFNDGLQPISSDDDLELVGLAKKKKTRKKKRRRKSLSLSLSPPPISDHLSLSIKDSIHRAPTRRHQSPARRKPQQQQQQQQQLLHKSPATRKLSPQRMKKLKKPVGGDSPLQSRGTVTKLLKKVKKLEPFSTRSKEKRSSLKDKLSNIIGGKKSDEDETVLKCRDKSAEAENRQIIKQAQVQPADEEHKKEIVILEEQKEKEVIAEDEEKGEDEDLSLLREQALSTKHDKPTSAQAANKPERPQEPDEDLQLRVIALRSAVMKKHRTRLARAKKQQLEQQAQQSSCNDAVPRIESPFTSSFNEDFPLLAEICSPGSPLDPKKDDIYCPEDMDLDSDMELDNEISMVLSAADDESNNVLNGDSPYSPTDDLASLKEPTSQPMDLSLYTPSKPTESPIILPDSRKNDTLDGSILESRPYSPSDATVYDPELPGVLGTATSVAPPLPAPPLPPLAMMPIMPLNPINLLGTFPMMPMAGFAPVNPMLTAPFIPFTPTTATAAAAAPATNNVTNNVTTQLIEEFGETDLDGSPLVPIEPKDANWKFIGEPLFLPEINKVATPGLVPATVLKSNKHLQKTPPMKRPTESLFKNADMRPVSLEEENRNNAATFKPIKLPTAPKKAVTTNAAAAFDASVEELTDSQKQIWPELEQDLRELEELEEQENRRRQQMDERKKQEQREAEERKRKEQEDLEKRKKQEQREAEEKRRHEKEEEAERRRKREREEADRRRRQTLRRIRQKSVTPAPRRRYMRTPSRARDLPRTHKSSRSSRDSESRTKSTKAESNKDEKQRKVSIDDDEQALREILLASLAKRKPNAKRKAALEAAKKKAAVEAAKATSDKENIAEKPAQSISASAQVDTLKDTDTNTLSDERKEIEMPAIAQVPPPPISPSKAVASVPSSSSDLQSLLMPTVLQQPTLKRPASALLAHEQPLRKVVKRLNVIPASTRAVNNAKRYQNLLLQRKLTQQKLALYKTRFAVNNGQRSQSPQIMQPLNEAQRFVISLNEDTESESEADDKMDSPTKSRPTLMIPTSDFEKSVDQFLKGVRMQQELLATTTSVTISRAVAAPIVAKATSSLMSKTTAISSAIPAVAAAAAAATTPAADAKVAAATSIAVADVAVTPSVTIAVPEVVTTTTAIATAAISSPKHTTILNIPKPTTTSASFISITDTPQAVKHLPATKQEEYRRLKQQIYKYELDKLRLQKVKETAATCQAQQTIVKPVNTSSSPSTPVTLGTSTAKAPITFSPAILTTSTPKAPIAKPMPKTQLIAAVSPVSKPSSISPVMVNPTKTVQSTSNVTTKTIAPTIDPANKITTSGLIVASSSRPIVSSVAKVTRTDVNRMKLLSKITESLNSQKTLLTSAANKISSLKVLTMEQINQKTSQIQQKNHCVMMDDLNKTAENIAMPNKKNNAREIAEKENLIKSKEPSNRVEKVGATRENVRFASSAVEKSKDEDKPKQSWEDFRQVVNDEVQTLSNLSTEEQKNLLSETEEKLISKRHAVLDDITEMSGSLRQWEIERDLQNIITTEIVSLREQLRIAEEKLQGQKMKLQTIQPKVTLYHEKINTGRKECFRLSKICNGLGQQIVGSDYKVPTAGAELLNNRIKEVANHTQKLRAKKTLSVQSNNSAKTDGSLKSNPKVNVNQNLCVGKFSKKQKNIVLAETGKSVTTRAIKRKISGNAAPATVSNLVKKTPNCNNIFNNTNNQSMGIDSRNSNKNKSQSTNVNVQKHRSTKTVSEKTLESHSKVTNSIAVHNAIPSNMQVDNRCDASAVTSNAQALRNSFINNESASGSNEIINNEEVSAKKSAKEIENVKTSRIHGIINKIRQRLNREPFEESETVKLADVILITNVAKNEQLPAVQVQQAADVAVTIEKTDKSSDAAVPAEMLNNAVEPDKMESESVNVDIIDGTRTNEQSTNSGPTTVITDNVESDSVYNNNNNKSSSVVNTSLDDYMKEMTVSDDYDNMCSKDCKSNASVTSNDHSTTFEEECRLLELASEGTGDYQSFACAEHATSDNCQSTEYESMDDVTPQRETIDNCRSIASIEHTTSDNCQSTEKTQHETIGNSQAIATVEHQSGNNSESAVEKMQQDLTDNPASKSLPKTTSNQVFRPYESILKLVRAPRNEKTDGILCPFALMGTCIDRDCRYIHPPASRCR